MQTLPMVPGILPSQLEMWSMGQTYLETLLNDTGCCGQTTCLQLLNTNLDASDEVRIQPEADRLQPKQPKNRHIQGHERTWVELSSLQI